MKSIGNINAKGLSFYISFGNKGFEICKDGPTLRISLWFISFSVGLIDTERIIRNLLSKLDDADSKEEKFIGDISKIQKEKDVLDYEKEELKRNKIYFKEQIKDFEEKAKGVQEKFIKSNEREKDLLRQISDLNEEIEDLNSQVDDLTDQVDNLEANKIENERLNNKVELYENTINTLDEEKKALEEKIFWLNFESSSSSSSSESSSSSSSL